MENFNSYGFIILASFVLIISYFFNIISRKTNIPSVLMLILLGFLIKYGLHYAGYESLQIYPVLEVLGIIGLIMIVLEAALDLKITRDKLSLIMKSLGIALISLILNSVLLSFLLSWYLHAEFFNALVYAIPLSIVSSAITIPSVVNLQPTKREFMIYESTFSDILGIMAFYFLIESMNITGAWNVTLHITVNFFITVVVSLLASYLLVFLFQSIKSEIKLFVLIAALIILYSIGKLLHLSSLLVILVFGLVLDNHHIFFRGRLRRYLNQTAVKDIYTNFKLVTFESSFVVRTFFFVVFGMSLTLGTLLNARVFIISIAILFIIYGIRFISLRIFLGKKMFPEIFTAPRGLITILLFYAIPAEFQIPEFESGILLYTIIISSLMMAFALIKNGKDKNDEKEVVQNADLKQVNVSSSNDPVA